jgi:hypothetical protein
MGSDEVEERRRDKLLGIMYVGIRLEARNVGGWCGDLGRKLLLQQKWN